MMKNKFVFTVVIIIFLIAGLLSQFASSYPDGLERVAEDVGFIKWAKENILPAPIDGYSVDAVSNEGMSTGLAGIIGLILTFSIVYIIGKVVSKKA